MSAQPTDGPGEDPDPTFEEFYRSAVPRLVAFLVWSGASVPDAADVVQDAMCRLYTRWDGVQNPLAWCRTVVLRDWLRRVAARREAPVAHPPSVSPLLPDATGSEAWLQQQEVLRLLSLLPERQRQVLACAVDGLTPSETALLLGIRDDAVRANLYKARRSLLTHLRVRDPGED